MKQLNGTLHTNVLDPKFMQKLRQRSFLEDVSSPANKVLSFVLAYGNVVHSASITLVCRQY